MKKYYMFGIIYIICTINLFGCEKTYNEDFSYYQNKVWVEENQELTGENLKISFIITNIENSVVEGNFSMQEIMVPDSYSLKYDSETRFVGELDKNIITLMFFDREGNPQEINLYLKENRIYGRIIDLDDSNSENNGFYKEIEFTPYNLADLKISFDDNKEKREKIVLDGWGEIYFISEIVNKENKVYPIAYLVDKEGNILYLFRMYEIGSEITEIRIEDIDKNLKKDIVVKGDFYDGIGEEFVYFQMENGWFLSKENCSLNIEKDCLEKQVENVNLSKWGNVNLVFEKYTNDNLGKIQTVYIEDMDGNSLYQFPINYLGNFNMKDYKLIDVNEDGLVDVKIIFYDENDICKDEIIFFQINNGWFLEK